MLKRSKHDANHQPQYSAEVKERAALYLYYLLGFHDLLQGEMYCKRDVLLNVSRAWCVSGINGNGLWTETCRFTVYGLTPVSLRSKDWHLSVYGLRTGTCRFTVYGLTPVSLQSTDSYLSVYGLSTEICLFTVYGLIPVRLRSNDRYLSVYGLRTDICQFTEPKTSLPGCIWLSLGVWFN